MSLLALPVYQILYKIFTILSDSFLYVVLLGLGPFFLEYTMNLIMKIQTNKPKIIEESDSPQNKYHRDIEKPLIFPNKSNFPI